MRRKSCYKYPIYIYIKYKKLDSKTDGCMLWWHIFLFKTYYNDTWQLFIFNWYDMDNVLKQLFVYVRVSMFNPTCEHDTNLTQVFAG